MWRLSGLKACSTFSVQHVSDNGGCTFGGGCAGAPFLPLGGAWAFWIMLRMLGMMSFSRYTLDACATSLTRLHGRACTGRDRCRAVASFVLAQKADLCS